MQGLFNLFALGVYMLGLVSPSDYQFYHDGYSFETTVYYDERGESFTFSGNCDKGWRKHTAPPIDIDWETWCGVELTAVNDTLYHVDEGNCNYVVELHTDGRWDVPTYPFCSTTERVLKDLNSSHIPQLQLLQNGWGR